MNIDVSFQDPCEILGLPPCLFEKALEAYDVLHDPSKRNVYDKLECRGAPARPAVVLSGLSPWSFVFGAWVPFKAGTKASIGGLAFFP